MEKNYLLESIKLRKEVEEEVKIISGKLEAIKSLENTIRWNGSYDEEAISLLNENPSEEEKAEYWSLNTWNERDILASMGSYEIIKDEVESIKKSLSAKAK